MGCFPSKPTAQVQRTRSKKQDNTISKPNPYKMDKINFQKTLTLQGYAQFFELSVVELAQIEHLTVIFPTEEEITERNRQLLLENYQGDFDKATSLYHILNADPRIVTFFRRNNLKAILLDFSSNEFRYCTECLKFAEELIQRSSQPKSLRIKLCGLAKLKDEDEKIQWDQRTAGILLVNNKLGIKGKLERVVPYGEAETWVWEKLGGCLEWEDRQSAYSKIRDS